MTRMRMTFTTMYSTADLSRNLWTTPILKNFIFLPLSEIDWFLFGGELCSATEENKLVIISGSIVWKLSECMMISLIRKCDLFVITEKLIHNFCGVFMWCFEEKCKENTPETGYLTGCLESVNFVLRAPTTPLRTLGLTRYVFWL